MTNQITNQDLYNAINDLRKEITANAKEAEDRCIKRYDKITLDVASNTSWRNRVTGQFAIITVALGFGINWLFDKLSK